MVTYVSADFPHEDVFTSIMLKECMECFFLYASVLTDLHCNARYTPSPRAEASGQQLLSLEMQVLVGTETSWLAGMMVKVTASGRPYLLLPLFEADE
jgi:hypothetical protein